MNTIIDYCLQSSNYRYMNANNTYNCMYDIFMITPIEKRREIDIAIKKNIGDKFHHAMNSYFLKKGLIVQMDEYPKKEDIKDK